MVEKILTKILIIRLSSLGDILLTTPVLRALRKLYPESRIDYLLRSQYADVLRFNPHLTKLQLYNDSEHSQIKNELKQIGYDLIFDLHNNLRSNSITRSLAVPTFRFTKPTLKKLLLVHFKINLLQENKSIPHMYAESIPNLGLDDKGLDLYLPENIVTNLNEVVRYIGFCPGSKHFTKRWPLKYFIELGHNLADKCYTIVTFGGKDDMEVCAIVSSEIKRSINLCNNDNLLQTAANMKKCKLIICNDSGLMHTASAVGIPIITILGSSVKEFGFMPYAAQNLILENKSLSCRPCSHIGRDNCPKGHFKCMKEITHDIVLQNALTFLAGS